MTEPKETIQAIQARYKASHVEVLLKRRHDYYDKHAAEERKKRREYYWSHQSKEQEAHRSYRVLHPEKDIEYRKSHVKYRLTYNRLLYDWLILNLGNKCAFCDSQNDLQIDHKLGVWELRKFGNKHKTIHYLLQDFDNGEPLRLLCETCHRISHAFRV